MMPLTARAALLAAAPLLGGCPQSDPPPAARSGSVPAAVGAWRETFPVDKSRLVPVGVSPFFDLRPGAAMTYRGGATMLTIRALDETRVVDGVTTRVVEEHEEEDGHVIEISRNFFAIDPATQDVYYFGEDVDVYKNDKIAGHPGGWTSGVAGAHFGLAMPGKAVLGDRFYQELAPGVAMDRVEIVGVDDRVETPAGVFEHCVHTRESTPLERGAGDKWYAPGVGLVRDEEVALVARGVPPH